MTKSPKTKVKKARSAKVRTKADLIAGLLIGAGKVRQVNVRFSAMASHYLFEPGFCNPASGWEKRLSLLSSGLPWFLVSNDGVEDGEELARDGDDGADCGSRCRAFLTSMH